MQIANVSHFEHDRVKIHTSMWGGGPDSNLSYWVHYTNESVFYLRSAKNISDTNAGLKTMNMIFHLCLTEAVPRQSKLPLSITALN
jgi:hypothetical protein